MKRYVTTPAHCLHPDVIKTHDGGFQDDWLCQSCGETWPASFTHAEVDEAIARHGANIRKELP